MTEDNLTPLADEPFDYHVTKDNKVFIYWHDKAVTTLAGKQAQKFLRQLDGQDAAGEQLVMARFTGNFKRGNEREGKNKNR
jgi:hypothetical protein